MELHVQTWYTVIARTIYERAIAMDKKVDMIKDAYGRSIVVINDLRFKGRRSVDWNTVEDCLKEYIGECAGVTNYSVNGTTGLLQHCRQYVCSKDS